MPRASKTATKAEETEQAVNSTAETEKPQETANTNATEERFIYISTDNKHRVGRKYDFYRKQGNS